MVDVGDGGAGGSPWCEEAGVCWSQEMKPVRRRLDGGMLGIVDEAEGELP